MKRILCIAAVVALAGCAWLTPAKFDPMEQYGYAGLWQSAAHLERSCYDPDSIGPHYVRLQLQAELLAAYVHHQDNAAPREIMAEYRKLLDNANPIGKSRVFCEESAKNLQDAANRAMQTNGRRPR